MSSSLDYPNVVADTAEMTREQWLEARRRGVGGSDAAAVLGVSPWTSRYSLWRDKTDDVPRVVKQTAAMTFGNQMEPVIAGMFNEQTGMQVMSDTNLYSHPEHNFMLANLDGLISTTNNDTPDAVLEVKTSRMVWDRVPDYYVSQVQHYMAVTNLGVAYVAALFGGEEFTWFEVPRNDQYIDRLVNEEAAFWEAVTKAVEPDIDGSEATYNAIRKSYDALQGKSVELPANVNELIEWRASAKELVGQYEKEVREAESKIMEALKDADTGTINGKTVVTWREQTRTSVDTKALKEAHPELVEQFTKGSKFRVLRVK